MTLVMCPLWTTVLDTARYLDMTQSDGAPPPELTWKERYQLAICEIDHTKLPQLIDRASEAILLRMNQTTRESASEERQQLSDAINGLLVLRREYEDGLKELARQRGTGLS